MNSELLDVLREALRGVTFSQREVAKIYHCRKEKVQKLLGTEIRCEQISAGGRLGCNAFDVLKPIIKQYL